uniref:type VI secretion system contractile sheath small subunit n=1 Tax=Methylobacterium sp. B34 TaxID=95563 RepID=UPI0027D79EEE
MERAERPVAGQYLRNGGVPRGCQPIGADLGWLRLIALRMMAVLARRRARMDPLRGGEVMSESIQKKLESVRPPRVKLMYEVHTGGATEMKELPFLVGVLADLSGKPEKPLPKLKE